MGAVRGWLRYRAEMARLVAKKTRKTDEYWSHMMVGEADMLDRLLVSLPGVGEPPKGEGPMTREQEIAQ